MYVHTCYVLIKPPMPIHYVLAAVFASCFYVLIYLLQEWGHIFYYVLAAVFASCFYVLFKIRFVRGVTQGGTLVNPFNHELK
jgi:ATP/ADP translocase